jgi:WD40 repeat protein
LKDDSLYIADKFGDIILFDQNNNKGTVIAGCLSIITDLLVTEDLIYVADRDEKIRILDRKAPFLIKSFLLEHEQYIFALEMYKNVLISLGSDGKLIFWSDEKVILEFGKGDPLTISIDEEREEIAFGVKNEDGCFLFKWRNDAGVLVSEKLDFDLTSMVHWDGELILAGYKDGQPFVKGIPGFVEFVPSLNLKADACNLNHHLEHLRKRLKN